MAIYETPIFAPREKRKRPGGNQMPRRESQIEQRLARRVKELGGEVRKVAWIGRKGAPDRLVMLPNRTGFATAAEVIAYRDANCIPVAEAIRELKGPVKPAATIWVELKAPGGAATFPKNAHERAQQREHDRMRKMGQRVEVVDSYQRIEEILA